MFVKVILGDCRAMPEIEDETIDAVITSPPYWHIKDYGVEGQIGYSQTLHEYLRSLYMVWKESLRVLKKGSRLCINIGDQFLRSAIYGRYKIAPLHSEIISQCEKIGFDYMGAIIWQKKTTMNTTGGANVMGSYPFPPNGMIEIDYEFILIFKKPGSRTPPPKEIKERSKLTKEEWKTYFSGHWNFAGEKQIMHEAMFPEELPKRLIKMFTFVGDTVLDPFLGSGTTLKAAIKLERNGIGYEINEKFLPIIKQKLSEDSIFFRPKIEIIKREKVEVPLESSEYQPHIKDSNPLIEPGKINFKKEELIKVKRIIREDYLELENGLIVKLIGISILNREKALEYLENFVKGKEIFIKLDSYCKPENNTVPAYVFLRNKIFINKEMIKLGIASVADYQFKYRKKFLETQRRAKNEKRVDTKHSL